MLPVLPHKEFKGFQKFLFSEAGIDMLDAQNPSVNWLGGEGLLTKLRPGGYFITSHSESLHGVTEQLQMVKPSIYRKQRDCV